MSIEKNKDKNKLRKIINWILNILIIIFGIGAVYMIIDRIFGNSPTDFQIILWISGFLGSSIIKLFNVVYMINREIGEVKTELKFGVRNGFKGVKKDINEVKVEVHEIKNLLNKNKK
ncbi:hypothetical protein J4221_05770 [Candidatus Pacearchaeota archaeon]|nr:hypothetical protein [Candidatus Pacearchaeota archaeon]